MYKFNFHNIWLEKYFNHIETSEIVEIGENHHIYPKCIFGPNDITKKISVLDHFKAHWFLYKAFKEYKDRDKVQYRNICFSLSQFNQVNKTRRKRLQTLTENQLEEYAVLCSEARQANTDASKGELNPQKRPEVREKISKANRGRLKGTKRSKEQIEKGSKSIIEQCAGKELIPVYHVITGEICKVHYQIAPILHENWQIGRKFKEKDSTLYWPPEYLQLKDSLRRKEYTTGVKKSKEHSDKINKNPDKIRKSVEKHLGSKRSEEQKKLMSEKRKEYLKQIGGASNAGKKIYHNPLNIAEIVQCFPDQQPTGWLHGNPNGRKKKFNESRTN